MATKTSAGAKTPAPKLFRAAALSRSGSIEAVACKGTALECSAFKAKGKTFLFIGKADAKLKLRESLKEAAELAARHPERYRTGANGWVTIRFAPADPLPAKVLERWVAESRRVVAG